jgi:DNA-binding LacI/PurR family transcriptional regulator
LPTIKDVAAEAGVSIATVSRVMNDPNYGSAKTRTKVIAAAKKLKYQANNIARSMVHGKTGIIALVIPDVRSQFFTDVARGVEDVSNKYDYRVMLCNTDEDLVKQRKYLDAFRGKVVDGFIIAVASEEDPYLKQIDREQMPFVFIDRVYPDIPADTVVVDNRDGAEKAVSHLIRLGHKRIGFIAGKRDTLTGRERLRGYLDAHQNFQLPVDETLIKEGGYTITGGYEAVGAFLGETERPSAIFVSNYAMMIGCLRALAEARVKIPDQMALTGFDDSEWAEFCTPPLTVIRQPTYTMGTLAGEILFQRLEKLAPPERKEIVLKPELIVRESCGVNMK